MAQRRPVVLVIDDEYSLLMSVSIMLKNAGFEVIEANGGRKGLEMVAETEPDAILSDIRMGSTTGIDILQAVKEKDPTLPVILMTAQASLSSAIEAVNLGAYFYIQKPFSNDELISVLQQAVESRSLRAENQVLKQEIRNRDTAAIVRPIGKSRSLRKSISLAETVAPTDSTILVTGESGTGKEVMARLLHQLSARSAGPFRSINCGALTETLLESELFGHVRGSFTGAVKDKEGLFVAAQGGTFFMDEVGEMSPATQVKLLRVLQEREVIPVGSTEPVKVDVRIIAATNRDLEEEVRSGRFRSDLYYRLNVISLHLPPLREREGDIEILSDYFLRRHAEAHNVEVPRLSDAAREALLRYEWPGNVRELENALERAVVLAKGGEIEAAFLPERVTRAESEEPAQATLPPNPTLEHVERAYIEWVLHSEGGNRTKAAAVLGIDASTLYRKLMRFKDEPVSFPGA